MIDWFLGHPIRYWIELQNHAEECNHVDLLQEIADLRAKVSFYESRLDDIQKFREVVE